MAAEVIEGMDGFLRSMKSLPLHVQEGLAVRSIRAALKPPLERVVQRTKVRSGALKDEIKISIDRSDPTNPIGGLGYTRDGFYGRFQYGHEGTGQGRRRGVGRRRSVEDQYRDILHAWDRSRDDIVRTLARRLGNGIIHQFKKLNKKAV